MTNDKTLAWQRFKHGASTTPNRIHWRDCNPAGSLKENCYVASGNPEFGTTLAGYLNQSCFFAMLKSNSVTNNNIKFGTLQK